MSARLKQQTLAQLGETGLIERLRRRLNVPFKTRSSLHVPVGDDAAVLGLSKQGRRNAPSVVLSADMLIEDVDFKFAWATPQDIGHKAAAANLSDLAAMGAQPRALLASVGCRAETCASVVLDVLTSLHRFGLRYGAPLVGGDLSSTSGPFVLSVTAVGEVDAKLALRRGLGRIGDIIAVTGDLGAAAAGLALLMQAEQTRAAIDASLRRRLIRRHLCPVPRIEFAMQAAKRGLIRSAIDVSDGIIKDAAELPVKGCRASIHRDALPILSSTRRAALALHESASVWACSGGEDFELALAIAPNHFAAALRLAQSLKLKLTAIGQIERGPGRIKIDNGETSRSGFEHFKTGKLVC